MPYILSTNFKLMSGSSDSPYLCFEIVLFISLIKNTDFTGPRINQILYQLYASRDLSQ